MFKTLSTLIAGVNARSEDRVRDAFAIELIDQKIREAEGSLKAAKATLASLLERLEAKLGSREAQEAVDLGLYDVVVVGGGPAGDAGDHPPVG